MDPDDDERPRRHVPAFTALLAAYAPSPAAGAPKLGLAVGLGACSLALLVPAGPLRGLLAAAGTLVLLVAGLIYAHRRRWPGPEPPEDLPGARPPPAATPSPLSYREEPEPPLPDALRFPAPSDDVSDAAWTEYAAAIAAWRDQVVHALRHESAELPRDLRGAASDLLRGLGAEQAPPGDDTPVFPQPPGSPAQRVRALLRWRIDFRDMVTFDPGPPGRRSESYVGWFTRGGRVLGSSQLGPAVAMRTLLAPPDAPSRCPLCLTALPEPQRGPYDHDCPLRPAPGP